MRRYRACARSGAADFLLAAHTFISATPAPRSVPRSATSRSRSSQFLTPAHRSAPAHQIFGPLLSSSNVSSSKLKRWTDFTQSIALSVFMMGQFHNFANNLSYHIHHGVILKLRHARRGVSQSETDCDRGGEVSQRISRIAV